MFASQTRVPLQTFSSSSSPWKTKGAKKERERERGKASNPTAQLVMAFLLPNLSPPLLLQTGKPLKEKPIFNQPPSSSSSSSSSTCLDFDVESFSVLSLSSVQAPPPLQAAQVSTKPSAQDKYHHSRDEFYVNLGVAVRTLREDLPLIFTKDLNYDIYRDDITFADPLNTFTGIENYKLIFWALRFHGRVLFREISLEILRVWQPSENMILIRWNLRGIPRVPWEAKGEFQGTSRYKLDRNGKIYEHRVDNLVLNFPQQLKPAVSVLDLVVTSPASPNPTFLFGPVDTYSSSWVEFYQEVRQTLDRRSSMPLQDSLVACS
ncbi:PREDICTED: uncharacterized protein LOC104808135 [Tarenaya hassleriana]|uniref:uncharacterized protein LOC104808135 n=1 Tax=Tarenaya hassleriana TaxID=28532 RepID=UPI00053C3B4F|nr:PREDICTED: uncharacterized protein LOC104808135 [Tarenaya hassleriana]